jgi:hypothetical protein
VFKQQGTPTINPSKGRIDETFYQLKNNKEYGDGLYDFIALHWWIKINLEKVGYRMMLTT